MNLPPEVKAAIEEATTEFADACKYSFLEKTLIREIMQEGAELYAEQLISTDLDEVMEDAIRHVWEVNKEPALRLNAAASACASIAQVRIDAALAERDEALRKAQITLDKLWEHDDHTRKTIATIYGTIHAPNIASLQDLDNTIKEV